MKNYIIFLFTSLFFIACGKEDPVNSEVQLFGFDNIENAKESLGEYANYGIYTDGSFNIDIEYGVFQANNTYFARFNDTEHNPIDAGVYTLNGKYDFTFQNDVTYEINNMNALDFRSDEVIKEMYGKDNSLKLLNGNYEVFSHEFYVPNDLNLQKSSYGEFEFGTIAYASDRRSTELNWNSDSKNETGVLVHMTWDGTIYNESGRPQNGGIVIQNAAVFNDTGNGTLPVEFFEGIPSNAKVALHVYRGTNDIITSDNKTLRISFNSRSIIHFIITN